MQSCSENLKVTDMVDQKVISERPGNTNKLAIEPAAGVTKNTPAPPGLAGSATHESLKKDAVVSPVKHRIDAKTGVTPPARGGTHSPAGKLPDKDATKPVHKPVEKKVDTNSITPKAHGCGYASGQNSVYTRERNLFTNEDLIMHVDPGNAISAIMSSEMALTLKAINNECGNTEWSVLLKTEWREDFLIISDEYYIPDQVVTSGSVDFEETEDLYALRTEGGWNTIIHKHPNGVSSFSASDDTTINSHFERSLLYVNGQITLISMLLDIPGHTRKLRTTFPVKQAVSYMLPPVDVSNIREKRYAAATSPFAGQGRQYGKYGSQNLERGTPSGNPRDESLDDFDPRHTGLDSDLASLFDVAQSCKDRYGVDDLSEPVFYKGQYLPLADVILMEAERLGVLTADAAQEFLNGVDKDELFDDEKDEPSVKRTIFDKLVD